MKRKVFVFFFITILSSIIGLIYLFYNYIIIPFTPLDKESSLQFKITPVSKTNSFVGPIKNVLDITFQHYFELTPEASFSQMGLYKVIVKNVPKNKDKGYLVVTRDKKTFYLPLVGVLSFKQSSASSYKKIKVNQLSNLVKSGDILNVHLLYTSSLTSLDTDQLRERLRKNTKGQTLTAEDIMMTNAISRPDLNENDILGMIYKNSIIKFKPSQLLVSLIELEK